MEASDVVTAPFRFVAAGLELFTSKSFQPHRAWGLLYLCVFSLAVYGHLMGKPDANLFWFMPVAGFIQTLIAVKTFTFLPREKKNTQGYYHATKAMSYEFITENIYFSGLLLFQSLYLSFPSLRSNRLFLPVELLGVFFPYHSVRLFFPKSSFRDSIKEGNTFALVTKVFYVIAKHASGFYVNYLFFLGKLGDSPVIEYALVRNLFILGGWGTTIAMFLHTLKFKKYISPFVAMVLYVGAFPLFYLCYAALTWIALDHIAITAVGTVGLLINFASYRVQVAWQTFVCLLFLGAREGLLPAQLQHALYPLPVHGS